MKSIYTNYVLSANTNALIEKAQKSAHDVRATIVKNKHDKVTAAQEIANKAFANANKSRQCDIFAAFCQTENPLVTACFAPVYAVDTYSIDKENNVSFGTREAVIDFAGLVAYVNANAKEKGVSAEWQGLVKSAVKYACIYVAEGLAVDQSKYLPRLRMTSAESQAVINPFSGVAHVSVKMIKSAMQSAVNALYGFNAAGKPNYWVNSEDVAALCQKIKWNDVTNNIVVPDMNGNTPFSMFFATLRHIVGGEEYGAEVKESRKGK